MPGSQTTPELGGHSRFRARTTTLPMEFQRASRVREALARSSALGTGVICRCRLRSDRRAGTLPRHQAAS
jgi:hypothetical protein